MDNSDTTDITASKRSSTKNSNKPGSNIGSLRGSRKEDVSLHVSQPFLPGSKVNQKPASNQFSKHGSAQSSVHNSTIVSVISYGNTKQISTADLKATSEPLKNTPNSTRSSKTSEKPMNEVQDSTPRRSIVKKSFSRGLVDPKKRVSVNMGSRTELLGVGRSSKMSISIGTAGSIGKGHSIGSIKNKIGSASVGTNDNIRNKRVYHQKEGQLFRTIANDSITLANLDASANNLRSKSLHAEIQKEILPYTVKSSSFHFPLGIGIGDVVPIPISSSGTDTSTTTVRSSHTDIAEKSIRYLMKLLPYGEEEYDEEIKAGPEEVEEVIEEQPETGENLAMRQAQRYLRVHKIFELLQFMTCHLLSACPDNPVEFFTELLEKCLIYRAGFANPPLLYTPKHLECLFYLMDRMRTGYIDLEQYKTGMVTLGICSFNTHPPLSDEEMVSKEFFVEEANDCLSRLLDDMIRRRWIRTKPPPITPPDSPHKHSKRNLIK